MPKHQMLSSASVFLLRVQGFIFEITESGTRLRHSELCPCSLRRYTYEAPGTADQLQLRFGSPASRNNKQGKHFFPILEHLVLPFTSTLANFKSGTLRHLRNCPSQYTKTKSSFFKSVSSSKALFPTSSTSSLTAPSTALS
jgi:hypothetical protein